MGTGSGRRKVLIVEDDLSIRNLLYVLLAGLGCEGDVAYNGRRALAMIERERFDAVLLDLRCTNFPADHFLTQIREIRPDLVGRVLAITGEVADAQTLELIERHCAQHVPRHRLSSELWERLRTILGLSPSAGTTP
ncbi:MAG: response regulator [Gammaproteobacteria bacterium]